MDKLCNWFISVAPEPIAAVPKEKDGKTRIRESMISRLHMNSNSKINNVDRSADLDDLIKSRSDNDVDMDELIYNKQVAIEELDEVIEATRTLVSKNKKAIKRCEKYRWGDANEFTFQRIDINLVDVATTEEDGKTVVSFTTTPRRQTQNFGVPSTMPSELTEIIVEKSGFAGLPDYELFMERSLLLHNDVLKPFLVVLKGHLESIQMFYQEIETWIQAPEKDRDFLEQTFGIFFDVSLAEPEDDNEEEENTMPSTVQRSDSSTCTSVLEETNDEAIIFQDREDSSDDGVPAKLGDKTENSDGDVPEATGTDDESSDEDRPAILRGKPDLAGYSNTKTTFANQELTLKEYMAEGNYKLAFQIDKNGQKEKLEKFIEFLEG